MRGEDGPKRATKSFKDPTSCICKNLKNQYVFSKKNGSRGLPREAPQAHEGSQEAPKERQDLKNKGSKNEPEKYEFLDIFLPILGAILGPEWAPEWVQSWFLPVFVDFEILEGRPAIARGYTLSAKVPRAASRAVLFTN